jgi:hypothetical protein
VVRKVLASKWSGGISAISYRHFASLFSLAMKNLLLSTDHAIASSKNQEVFKIPKPGYRAITINSVAYGKVVEVSNLLNKSVPETILFLAEEFLKPKQTESVPAVSSNCS